MTTATIFDQPTTPAGQVITEIYHIGVSAGAGALAGLVFGIVNPVGGAIFGAAYAVTSLIGRALINCLPIEEAAAKTALHVASFILSIGIGIIATTYVGFTLTALGAIGMLFAMIPTAIFLKCTGACIAGCPNGTIGLNGLAT